MDNSLIPSAPGIGTASGRPAALCAGGPREQERQRDADPGQHDEGQEGGLEALVQHDERIRTVVCRQAVLGAGARQSSERVTATVVAMATPSAAPICKAVLLRPEESPDSCSATPQRSASAHQRRGSGVFPSRTTKEPDGATTY
jgi:hypothetical protein